MSPGRRSARPRPAIDVAGFDEGLEEQRAPGAQARVAEVGDHRLTVDAFVGGGAGEFEDGRRDVDLLGGLAGRGAGFDPRPADQERQVGGRLVGEELAADQPVLAEEEAVVRGEDDVGVAEAAGHPQRVEHPFDAVVDPAQGLQLLLPVDAVGVLVVEAQVFGFADEAGLVGDVALVEPFGAVVGETRALEPVVLAGRRLGPGRAAEVAVGGGVVELQVERLFGRGGEDFVRGQLVR